MRLTKNNKFRILICNGRWIDQKMSRFILKIKHLKKDIHKLDLTIRVFIHKFSLTLVVPLRFVTARDRWFWMKFNSCGIGRCTILVFFSSNRWYDLMEQKYILTLMETDWLVEKDLSFTENAIVLEAFDVVNLGSMTHFWWGRMKWSWQHWTKWFGRFYVERADRLSSHVEYRFKVLREINPTIGFGRSRSTGHCRFHCRLYLDPRRWRCIWGNCRRSLTVVGISSVDDGCWGWLVDRWSRSV